MNPDLARPEAKLSTIVICSFLLGIVWGLLKKYDFLQSRCYYPLFTRGEIVGRGSLDTNSPGIEWSGFKWRRNPRIVKQGFNWGRVWRRLPGVGIGEAGL